MAADVCRVLGIANPRDAILRLDRDERDTVVITDGTPGNPNKTAINEAGLYSLVMTSRKPEAVAFKKWVTWEVLPSIRKNGGYIAGQEKVRTGEMSDLELSFPCCPRR